MELSAQKTNGVLYVKMRGELDEHSASDARRRADMLIEANARATYAVFDLDGVSFMDSTGIGFLIGRYKKLQRYGIPMYIANPDRAADKVLAISGIYTLIPRLPGNDARNYKEKRV